MTTKKKAIKAKTSRGGQAEGKRSSRAKPETEIVLLGELEEAVSRLAQSPRFDFLKNLVVSEFTASRKATPLGAITFGDLNDRLRTTESLGDDIATLPPADHAKLLKAISELGGIPDSDPPSSPQPPPPPIERAPRPEPPRLSSVEAERRLTDAITALKNAPNFHLIKFSRLGDFWEEGWQRAPFEEALTLQQITEMKVSAMLEKRSFGPTKILNFVYAIERAIGGRHTPTSLEPSSPPPTAARTPTSSSTTEATSFWNLPGTKLPAHATATLRYLEGLAATNGADTHPLARLLVRLPMTLTATETAVAWFRQESDNDVVASLMHLAPASAADIFESANNKLAALFRDVAPSESRSWLVALQSPGISIEELLATHPGTMLPPEALNGLGRMLLRALGANHPIVFGRPLGRYFTKTPAAAGLILKNLIGNFPQAEAQVEHELRALLPFFAPEDIRPLLLTHAHFHERDRVWMKK